MSFQFASYPLMKNKTTFKDVLATAPKPRILTLDERLPHVFDVCYDVKTLRELLQDNRQSGLNKEHLRPLAESGYDITKLPTLPED